MITYESAVHNVTYPFIVLLLSMLVSLIVSSSTTDPKTKEKANLIYGWFMFLVIVMVVSVIILPGWDMVRYRNYLQSR